VTDRRPPRLAVLADDLMWATRLGSIARVAGAIPVVVGTVAALAGSLASVDAAIVDLALRRDDPESGIAAARAAGVPVVAVGPHEDRAARRRALAAGATRVFAYSKLHDDGPRTIAAWLGVRESPSPPALDAVREAEGGTR
jgi:hypothetical protein